MVEIRAYHLQPTELIPNSPRPLLHYKNVMPITGGKCSAPAVYETLMDNGWDVQWVVRYGATQMSHFHSRAHESMVVLSGTATIRFGVADTSDDLDANTHGGAWEAGGVELDAKAGDVFVIPAGVAHKTMNALPAYELSRLTPGTGHGIEAEDPKKALSEIKLDGFTMMGCYNGGEWDFVKAGGIYEASWSIPKPKRDPVFGDSDKGILGLWRGGDVEVSTSSNKIPSKL